MNYLPLNVISGYTLLSSGLKIKDICQISLINKIKYACVSEFENMNSFPILNSLCQNNNLTPIYGISFNIKINEIEILTYFYIENENGYRFLCKFLTQEHTIENLNSYTDGLTIVIPTLSNPNLCDLLKNNINKLSEVLFKLTSKFNNVYLGIEYYKKDDKDIVNSFRLFCETHNYKKISFPKHLYEKKSDAIVLKILEAIKNDYKLSFNDHYEGPYFFLSEKAINTLYKKDEIENSFKMAENLHFTFNLKRGKLIEYTCSNNLETKKFLEFSCKENATRRNIFLSEEYIKRLNYEIDIIDKMGYCSYFLIVMDYVNYAKSHNYPVGPGRGSAAGSLVSYLLGITDVDPIKYNLMFERFLNPDRITMPDIDIDIADTSRSDVINYIFNKYGKNRMANIVTYQNIGAKQSIRDIGKIFSINNSDINTLCNLIKNPNLSLDETINANNEFKNLYRDSYYKRIIDYAKKIEGFPRQESIHPAGIILNNDDITNLIPTKIGSDNHLVCQYESIYLEKLGFLKMDILGLKNLSIISSCINKMKDSQLNLNINKIPLSDEKTFNILNAGLTQGIFQLEGEGITNALKKIKIQSFDDLVALLALYRPGPMDNINLYASRKNNHEKITYQHPLLKEVLQSTYGVIIYQEQIMEIVQKISKFSLAQADLFRRAISKKDQNQLNELRKSFIDGALSNHIEFDIANQIFELIYKFANYGFNKSHSVSYALISYQMAYLKANYPSVFYSVLLDYQSNASDRYSKFKNEFNLIQIKLILPSINNSGLFYMGRNGKILLPLSVIKNLPPNLANAILYERKQNGRFTSFENVITRLYPYGFNSTHFLALINSGAVDEFNYNRKTMRKSLSILIQYANTSYSEINLLSAEQFEHFKPIIKIYSDDHQLNLEEEFNTIGIMISGSLFDRYSNYIKAHNIKEIFNVSSSNANVNIGVIIIKTKEILAKSGKKMAKVLAFDNSQEIEITLFNNVYETYHDILKASNAIMVNGFFNNSDNYGLSFIGEYIELMEENEK